MTDLDPSLPYTRMGGDPAVRALVAAFYDRMDRLSEAAPIRAMHNPDLSEARDKLYKFLSGWLGGPPLYWEEYGHPRLRRRHMAFAIDDAAAAQWMLCMNGALDEIVADEALRADLSRSFAQVADHMRNRPG